MEILVDKLAKRCYTYETMKLMKLKCDDCKFCLLEDYGYSNYTVEGTDASCIIDMNPGFPADHRWGESDELNWANICPRFKEGYAVAVDVDHESGHILNYVDDPEVRVVLEKEYMWEIMNEKHRY